MPLKRRAFLGLLAGGILTTGYFLMPAPTPRDQVLSPLQALKQVQNGTLILIDIRRPEEWHATGVAPMAHLIDMRNADFIAQLNQITGGVQDAEIALICAAGVRSQRLATQLTEAGFSRVSDVSEGMKGGRYGPGWIARELPVVPYSRG